MNWERTSNRRYNTVDGVKMYQRSVKQNRKSKDEGTKLGRRLPCSYN